MRVRDALHLGSVSVHVSKLLDEDSPIWKSFAFSLLKNDLTHARKEQKELKNHNYYSRYNRVQSLRHTIKSLSNCKRNNIFKSFVKTYTFTNYISGGRACYEAGVNLNWYYNPINSYEEFYAHFTNVITKIDTLIMKFHPNDKKKFLIARKQLITAEYNNFTSIFVATCVKYNFNSAHAQEFFKNILDNYNILDCTRLIPLVATDYTWLLLILSLCKKRNEEYENVLKRSIQYGTINIEALQYLSDTNWISEHMTTLFCNNIYLIMKLYNAPVLKSMLTSPHIRLYHIRTLLQMKFTPMPDPITWWMDLPILNPEVDEWIPGQVANTILYSYFANCTNRFNLNFSKLKLLLEKAKDRKWAFLYGFYHLAINPQYRYTSRGTKELDKLIVLGIDPAWSYKGLNVIQIAATYIGSEVDELHDYFSKTFTAQQLHKLVSEIYENSTPLYKVLTHTVFTRDVKIKWIKFLVENGASLHQEVKAIQKEQVPNIESILTLLDDLFPGHY